VLGHLEQALELFEHSAKLEPTDTVSAGLRDLLRDSITSDDEQTEETPPPVHVNPDKLVGTWVSKVADDGTITLVMTSMAGGINPVVTPGVNIKDVFSLKD